MRQRDAALDPVGLCRQWLLRVSAPSELAECLHRLSGARTILREGGVGLRDATALSQRPRLSLDELHKVVA
ncbi:hypothetical protein [Methylobacterium gregans]|uniref:hypothetical protein n=1 Tax=Methylobacterium gregans TaxID=374424 RepID=UPI00361C587D